MGAAPVSWRRSLAVWCLTRDESSKERRSSVMSLSRVRRLSPANVLGAFLAVALLFPLFWAPGVMPTAKAAFPGRKGLIVFPVRQCPCETGPVLALDYDLFLVRPGGSPLRRLTEGPGFDVQPAWSPDGRRIVFARGDALTSQADIYVINADGTGLINLTNTPGTVDFGPAFSPDGRNIVFNSDQASPEALPRVLRNEPDGDLYVMDADGGNVVQLTSGPRGQKDPSWSPDGKWIAFGETISYHERLAFPDRDIRLLGFIRPDGDGMRLLPELPEGAVSPQWSPDGKKIVFYSEQGDRDIWLINADGTSPKNLTPLGGLEDRAPVWSPDGRFILFLSDREGGYKLYLMRPDGSHVVRLTDIELEADATPDWGPRP